MASIGEKEMSVIEMYTCGNTVPDSKAYGANMGPPWGRQDPCGPHVGPMNLAMWGHLWKTKKDKIQFADCEAQ